MRNLCWSAALAFGLLGLVRAEDAPKGDAKELEKFAGRWQGVGLTENGKPSPAEAAQDIVFEFKGGTLIIFIKNEKVKEYGLSVDPSKSPKQLDLKGTKPAEKNVDTSEDGQGIYELDGDRLKIAVDESKKGRPADFKGEGRNSVVELKRVKP